MHKGIIIPGMEDSFCENECSMTLFMDERKDIGEKKNWYYIGILYLPSKQVDDFSNKLTELRRQLNFSKEMKFSDLKCTSSMQMKLASFWVDLFLNLNEDCRNKAAFTVFGIDFPKLDFSAFGEGASRNGKYATIYGRLLRSVFKGLIKIYFKDNRKVVIKDIYHDNEGQLQDSYWFDHQVISITERELFETTGGSCEFHCNHVTFIDSDTQPGNNIALSEIIQFVDVILGIVSHSYDRTPKLKKEKQEARDELARKMYSYLDNSGQTKHAPLKDICFFPTSVISSENIDIKPGFYRKRQLDKSLFGNHRLF